MQTAVVLYVVVMILFIGVIWLIISYSKLASTRARVRNCWSQINVQLKMRSDVIPGLVNTLGGYAKHEKGILDRVIDARNKFMIAKTPDEAMEISSEISKLLGRIFKVARQYPQLKDDQGFVNFQNQLNEIERKIFMYRQCYNDTVKIYNSLTITFPMNIIAKIFGFNKLPFFHMDEPELSVVPLNFNKVQTSTFYYKNYKNSSQGL